MNIKKYDFQCNTCHTSVSPQGDTQKYSIENKNLLSLSVMKKIIHLTQE